MGKASKIEWTHHTFNPWIGCARVSPGCEHCYAETMSNHRGWAKWGVHGTRKMMSDAYWREPLRWEREAEAKGEPRRVFCASLADVFEERPELEAPRARLYSLVRATPHLAWLLLTKRPENVDRLGPVWSPNVWLGTTVEDQRRADERIPHLTRSGAHVKFLSCEPLLGPVDLRGARIDWVIIGGESGGSARLFYLDDARSIVRQCRAAGIAVHVKQMGAHPYESRDEAGRPHRLPLLDTRKGGDWTEWPKDLQIREYPQ